MNDTSWKPWSDSPYAPQVPRSQYLAEKATFTGFLIGPIFYGIIVALFFRCMNALLNPADRPRTGVRWPFVVHIVAMFSFATVIMVAACVSASTSFVDNRGFPGSGYPLLPGPLGYFASLYSNAITIVPRIMFLLNHCLADGLLLYRCYVIHRMNYWVIAFPCLVYLASFAMGIVYICRVTQWSYFVKSVAANVGIPYFSISIAINVLLTLMIATRLILHSRNTRNALGTPSGASGLYKAIVAVLIESCALYSVNSLMYIILWTTGSWVTVTFLTFLTQIQVIAPFLIILRVSKSSTSTSNTATPTTSGSIRFGNAGNSTGSDETPREGESAS